MSVINKILLIIGGIVSILVPISQVFPAYALSFPAGTSCLMINPEADSLYFYRLVIILCALFLTIISMILLGISIFFSRQKNNLLNLSIFVYIFVVGWMFIPYWTNGLYEIFRSGISTLFDPEGLLPMTWMGEFWRLPIIIFFPFVIFYILFSLIRFAIITFKNKKTNKNEIMILVFNLLTIIANLFTPKYFYWLLG